MRYLSAWRLGLAVALVAALATPLWAKGDFRYKQVDCFGTIAHVVGGHDGRTALTLQNVGTGNVYLGGPNAIELRSDLGFTLHAGSTISFSRPTGDPTIGIKCLIDAGSTKGQRIQVIEEF